MTTPEKTVAENLDTTSPELEQLLYARHAEVETFSDLELQRSTNIPALFTQFYKFIQNPSSVSVETFKRMIDTDDTAGSGVDFLTTCLAARIGRYQHPSKEITEWVNDALEKIEGGFVNAMKELLSATWAGFAVSEKVWANTNEGFIIKKLVSLPPSTLLFETERTGEITQDGILQYQRNYNPAFTPTGVNYLFGFAGSATIGNGVRPDPWAKLGDFPFPLRTGNTYSYLSIRVPKMKCIHYAFDAQGKFGNPYGRSLLRRCHKFYTMKDAILMMLSVALDRKGTPLQVIFADPNQTVIDQNKFQQGTNHRNQQVGMRADVAALQAFKNVHQDSVIVLPGKKGQWYDIEVIPVTSNAGDFLEALKFCNQSILRALLVPSLIFGNGDGTGSYSLGQEHAKTFDKILDGMNAGLISVMMEQMIKELIAYNFPKTAWEKDGLGGFGRRELSVDEIDKEMGVIEKGVNTGAIDMNDLNDLNQVREKMGFEPLDQLRPKPIPSINPMDPFAQENENAFPPDDGRDNGNQPAPTGEGSERPGGQPFGKPNAAEKPGAGAEPKQPGAKPF